MTQLFKKLTCVLAILPVAVLAKITTVLAQPSFYDGDVNWFVHLQPAASPIQERIHSFYNLLLILMAAVVLLVGGLIVYVVIRFREKRNPVPSRTTHNVPLEIAWTLGPCLILAIIAYPSFGLLTSMDRPPEPDMTLKVEGYQWYWGYEYPDENIIFDSYMIEDKDLKANQPRLLAVDNEVVVPVNKVIKVLITANDVLHAWALPSFGVKRDAVPGRINETWFNFIILSSVC